MAKNYPIDQSILYRLNSKRKLVDILGIDYPKLKSALKDTTSYRVFAQKENGKSRIIEEPLGELRRVQDRLLKLLGRIDSPPYLHSGVKRRSYFTNAREHIGQGRILKTDVSKFFPSTTRHQVFIGFLCEFRCAGDVAKLLADICTYDGHVPTGSPISMPVAFFANKRILDGLYLQMLSKNIKLTVYVDDITLSGPGLMRLHFCPIKKAFGCAGYRVHKTRFFGSNPASVTGLVIKGDEILLPNRRHQRIADGIQALKTPNETSAHQTANTLRGQVNEAAYVDNTCRARLLGYNRLISALLTERAEQDFAAVTLTSAIGKDFPV